MTLHLLISGTGVKLQQNVLCTIQIIVITHCMVLCTENPSISSQRKHMNQLACQLLSCPMI